MTVKVVDVDIEAQLAGPIQGLETRLATNSCI
jgi:hypothetical protein